LLTLTAAVAVQIDLVSMLRGAHLMNADFYRDGGSLDTRARLFGVGISSEALP